MSRLLLKTPLSEATGYGNDGIALAQALSAAGYDVRLNPSDLVPPIPPSVAGLLTKPLEGPFDFLLHHVDPGSLGLDRGEARASRIKVAWTMWEYTSIEAMKYKSTLRRRLDTYDALLGYDPVSKSALEPMAPKRPVLPVHLLQGGFWADLWKQDPRRRDWSGTYRFGMVGQLGSRKNPFAAIRAFKSLKDEHGDDFDAELHLKTTVKTLHPGMEQWCKGIKIHYVLWSPAQLRDFYLTLHTLLSPSWGEGKNLPALEAQSSGCPVIVSDFGGHQVWARPEWAYLTKGSLQRNANSGGMEFYAVDEDHLRAQMWHVYTHRDEAKLKGDLASRTIPPMCDWTKVVSRLTLLMDTLIPRRP